MVYQNVFVIGATGGVGREVVRQIYRRGDTERSIHENPTKIVGLASSRGLVYDFASGIDSKTAQDFSSRETMGDSYNSLDEILNLVNDEYGEYPHNMVFVDVTALDSEATAFHLNVIQESDYGLVTANKNPLVGSFRDFEALASQTDRYDYSCSVMAGAHAIPFIQQQVDLGEKITGISGCFSGTLGYASSQEEQGIVPADYVREAISLGYTEPDWRKDFLGGDVANKLLILARTAGYRLDLDDIRVIPFLPEEILELDQDEAIEALSDSEFQNERMDSMRKAIDDDNTFRYCATMNGRYTEVPMDVRLKEVSRGGLLGSLQGTANKIVINTENDHPEDNPCVISAPGAGTSKTANQVRGGLLRLLKGKVRKF